MLVNYGRENIGSIFSILDSIWTIMKGNLSLVFKSATAILSILMGGGTAILNFIVNGVISELFSIETFHCYFVLFNIRRLYFWLPYIIC